MDRYGISLAADIETVSTLLDEALDWSLRQKQVVDYDDMIYVPVRLGLPIPRFDAVFVDEALDLNPVQIELVLRSVRPGGRVFAVGDRQQSLYGWRGADTMAIPNLINRLDATTLPLSISCRCPRRHVKLAGPFTPQMRAAPGAAEGAVWMIGEGCPPPLSASFFRQSKGHSTEGGKVHFFMRSMRGRVSADSTTGQLEIFHSQRGMPM